LFLHKDIVNKDQNGGVKKRHELPQNDEFFTKRYTKCYTFEIPEFKLSESADEPGFLSIG
jgi:hypothetical protein